MDDDGPLRMQARHAARNVQRKLKALGQVQRHACRCYGRKGSKGCDAKPCNPATMTTPTLKDMNARGKLNQACRVQHGPNYSTQGRPRAYTYTHLTCAGPGPVSPWRSTRSPGSAGRACGRHLQHTHNRRNYYGSLVAAPLQAPFEKDIHLHQPPSFLGANKHGCEANEIETELMPQQEIQCNTIYYT